MSHHYVSTYFYHTTENPIRKKLKDEFMERYPWVTLLELHGEPGFVDYLLINAYIRQIQKSSKNIDSLTIIDCDIILQDNFKLLVEKSIEDGFDVVHGFSEAFEALDNKIIPNSKVPAISHSKSGHSGFVWTFSRKFLSIINYEFPDKFSVGGADYIFACIFIKRYNSKEMYKYLLGNAFEPLMGKFYDQIKNAEVSVTTLNHTVIHNYHGSKLNRLTDFRKYFDILIDESIVPKLMQQRDQYH